VVDVGVALHGIDRTSIRFDCLESVVLFAQRVLVMIPRLFSGEFRIMHMEPGCIPLFHLHHGVVVVRQGFFGVNCIHPGVDRMLVADQ
jgi:hypothetical protein